MFYNVVITRARVRVYIFFGVLRYFFFVVSDARKLERKRKKEKFAFHSLFSVVRRRNKL